MLPYSYGVVKLNYTEYFPIIIGFIVFILILSIFLIVNKKIKAKSYIRNFLIMTFMNIYLSFVISYIPYYLCSPYNSKCSYEIQETIYDTTVDIDNNNFTKDNITNDCLITYTKDDTYIEVRRYKRLFIYRDYYIACVKTTDIGNIIEE